MSNGLNVGELIAELKKHKQSGFLEIDNSPVLLTPSGVDSYRGYYEQLAIEVSVSGSMTVGTLVELLTSRIGTTMTGYKGGQYPISNDTPVWISNYGECSHSRVTGVRESKHGIAITWERDE